MSYRACYLIQENDHTLPFWVCTKKTVELNKCRALFKAYVKSNPLFFDDDVLQTKCIPISNFNRFWHKSLMPGDNYKIYWRNDTFDIEYDLTYDGITHTSGGL